jgi:nucleoside-diphosphate-sugar epimerase
MKLLVLGGTKFLGRAVVDAALQAGHEITLFNRGQQDPGAFPALEQIHGDRTTAEGRARLGAARGTRRSTPRPTCRATCARCARLARARAALHARVLDLDRWLARDAGQDETPRWAI